MAPSTPERLILTWDDLRSIAETLPPDLHELVLELVGTKVSAPEQTLPTGGNWHIESIELQGHVGVGAIPLKLTFPPGPGIVIVSAPNGTGKTTVADGVRYALSNRAKRRYDIAENNLHFSHRSIRVVVTNGPNSAEITCEDDGPVRWHSAGSGDCPLPAGWIAAFTRFLPVLLYPEIARSIDSPSGLHEFLAGALELTVLEELLGTVDELRERGRTVGSRLDTLRVTAASWAAKASDPTLVDRITESTSIPNADARALIRKAAAALPDYAPPRIDLVPLWRADEAAWDRCFSALTELDKAHAAVVPGAESLRSAFDHLLGLEDNGVGHPVDTCPVCGTQGANWLRAARARSDSLGAALSGVRQARLILRKEAKTVTTLLPPAVPETTKRALLARGGPEAADYVKRWEASATHGSDVANGNLSKETLNKLRSETSAVMEWYQPVKAAIESDFDNALADQVRIRTYIDAWLDSVKQEEPTTLRGALADRLARRIEQWIKATRAALFAPIAAEVSRLWAVYNPDSDLAITNVYLDGGVRQKNKVAFDFTAGGTAVTEKKAPAVLSTGQRNALAVATYLPRATQQASPFRFLILDDPIHSFDGARLRHFAESLTDLAYTYQVIVFTHDERLWLQLRALGEDFTHYWLSRSATAQSEVVVKKVESPAEQILTDLERALRYESTAPLGTPEAVALLTLANCRQALDSEVVMKCRILGRRANLSDEVIESDLSRSMDTRAQLDLLNRYATLLQLTPINHQRYRRTIEALNEGAHGRAPTATPVQRNGWVADTRRLTTTIAGLGV